MYCMDGVMSRFIDLSERVFTHLTVLVPVHQDSRRIRHWHCRCSCGEMVTVAGNNLTSGNSKSCGCFHGVAISTPITLEQLKTLVTYNPRTGIFTWNVDARSYKRGDVAGYYNEANGYVRLTFKKDQYYAHVLAWFYMTGQWRAEEIDHRDLDGANNRWKNLREATHGQNGANKNVTSRNKTGFKGVQNYGNKFSAHITHRGQQTKLGVFSLPEEAAKAYDAAAIKFHGEFARLNFP